MFSSSYNADLTRLLLFHTTSGSFLPSLEKRLEEYAKIAYETQIKRASLCERYTQLTPPVHLYFILNSRIIRAWIKPKKIGDYDGRIFHQKSINKPQKYATGKYYYHSKRNVLGGFSL